jgi:hypothetical protein
MEINEPSMTNTLFNCIEDKKVYMNICICIFMYVRMCIYRYMYI